MATIYEKRLSEKYGDELKGRKYRALAREILVHNSMKAGRAVGRLSASHYKTSIKKLSPEKAKVVKLPDMDNVLPKRSVFMIKAADSGKSIMGTLRDQLSKDLRETLQKFDGTGENRMEVQRGRTTGKMNPKLVQEFQKSISETFESRTRKDPKLGFPKNIRNIAVTEIRSTVNSIKEKYNKEFARKNKGILRMVKTWKHNRRLSKEPRLTHMEMDGVTIDIEKLFEVGRDWEPGFDYMDRPHDPHAPAEQTIGCSCELIYKALLR